MPDHEQVATERSERNAAVAAVADAVQASLAARDTQHARAMQDLQANVAALAGVREQQQQQQQELPEEEAAASLADAHLPLSPPLLKRQQQEQEQEQQQQQQQQQKKAAASAAEAQPLPSPPSSKQQRASPVCQPHVDHGGGRNNEDSPQQPPWHAQLLGLQASMEDLQNKVEGLGRLAEALPAPGPAAQEGQGGGRQQLQQQHQQRQWQQEAHQAEESACAQEDQRDELLRQLGSQLDGLMQQQQRRQQEVQAQLERLECAVQMPLPPPPPPAGSTELDALAEEVQRLGRQLADAEAASARHMQEVQDSQAALKQAIAQQQQMVQQQQQQQQHQQQALREQPPPPCAPELAHSHPRVAAQLQQLQGQVSAVAAAAPATWIAVDALTGEGASITPAGSGFAEGIDAFMPRGKERGCLRATTVKRTMHIMCSHVERVHMTMDNGEFGIPSQKSCQWHEGQGWVVRGFETLR